LRLDRGAYLLEKSDFPVTRVFATKGSGLEKEIKESATRVTDRTVSSVTI
jgi:hypothetical protein